MEYALIYGRVSKDTRTTATKSDLLASLDTQEQCCVHYANARGFTIQHVVTDPGVSGGKPIRHRPGGAKAINLIEHSQRSGDPIRHFIVSKLDRAGRNAIDVLQTVQHLESLGVATHFVNLGGESITTSGPIGRLLLVIMAAFAELERNMTIERTQENIDACFKAGQIIGTVPYGWDDIATGEFKKKGEKRTEIRKRVDNPLEQQWIRSMQDWRSAGHGWREIARLLTAAGAPSKSGRPWTGAHVRKILLSRHVRELLPHPPISQSANSELATQQ